MLRLMTTHLIHVGSRDLYFEAYTQTGGRDSKPCMRYSGTVFATLLTPLISRLAG